MCLNIIIYRHAFSRGLFEINIKWKRQTLFIEMLTVRYLKTHGESHQYMLKYIVHILLGQGINDYTFKCLPCAEGCDTCEDSSPCVLTLNWIQRSVVLGFSGLTMCGIPALIWFTVQCRDDKVRLIENVS